MFAFLLALALLAGSIEPADERRILTDIDAQRTAESAVALVSDDVLHAIAVDRANDMVTRHYFDHRTPEGRTAFVDALQSHAYRFTAAAENIAYGSTVELATQALWISPGHRENRLNPRFRKAGIAVFRSSPDRVYIVEIFSD